MFPLATVHREILTTPISMFRYSRTKSINCPWNRSSLTSPFFHGPREEPTKFSQVTSHQGTVSSCLSHEGVP